MKKQALIGFIALNVVGLIIFAAANIRLSADKLQNGKSEVLGCTTTCSPAGCGPYPLEACASCSTTCTTPAPGTTTAPTATPAPGTTTAPTPGPGNGCSQGCFCRPDTIGGCWCECQVLGGDTIRDTNQFACEGNPACEWGPTGCYCAAGGGGTGGGGGGGGGAPTPTPAGCNPANWGSYGSCFGSPAIKTRQNECGTWETVSCTGSIQARAAVVTSADTSCAAVRASTTGVSATTFQFTPSSASQPAPQTQTGNTAVSFSTIAGGYYGIVPTAPGDYVIKRACWQKTSNTPSPGEGLGETLSVPTDNDTLTWELGYTLGTPWFQAGGGGDVYAASGYLKSYVPSGTTPRYFSLNNSNGYSGVVSYGNLYDFDSDPAVLADGFQYISSTKWNVQESFPTQNFYLIFWRKFGGPLTPDYDQPASPITKPASRVKPYYVKGNMTMNTDWIIAEGETIIFLVDGNVNLNGKVTMTGNGFASFIASGNITVGSNVGVPPASSTPVLEGIYIASGTFQSGISQAGVERLVVKGSVIANNFLLQRDLGDTNTTTPAELFLYNPALLFRMPPDMMEVPYFWQEVAP